MRWLFFILLPFVSIAQGSFGNMGINRIVGSNSSGSTYPYYGRTQIIGSISGSSLVPSLTERYMWSNGANISSSSGKLLFYTNGYCVMDINGNIIANGDSLSPTAYSLQNWYSGLNFPQSTLIFQHKLDSSLYTMVHTSLENGSAQFGPLKVWRSEFKVNTDSSISVIEKNIVILTDTIEFMGITACKHANGRDWWVLIKNQFSTKTHLLLFTPDTMISSLIETPASPLFDNGALKVFSPNGNYYATYASHAGGVRIYNFDRCAGALSLISQIPDPDNASSAGFGISFSPTERFLYFNNLYSIYRVDMQSSLLPSDVELVYNYTPFMDSAFGYYNVFHVMELSNDGKLYISGSGSCRYYCTIDNPDAIDIADIGYHHFEFQIPYFNNHTYTNHANYTLGPLAGSPCDTLGLGKKGLLNNSIAIEIYPNPNKGNFAVNYSPQAESGMLYIYDMNGHVVFNEYIAPWSNIKNINLEHKLSNGIYALMLTFGKQTALAKFVVSP
ncbi:MAG: T9SS type A sorting domain-containing protein [Bacteroidia bacterium]|nr:T9SS type A sorting domain-containing protein [Bacteroidia bacterium]